MKKIAGLLLMTLYVGSTVLPAAEPTLTRFTFTEPHMGTLFKITVYAPDEATATRASRAAFERAAALDAMMTDYRSTSELMRLCARAGGVPVAVSEDLFTVLERAQQVARRSGGAFDVTVGPVVRLWRPPGGPVNYPKPTSWPRPWPWWATTRSGSMPRSGRCSWRSRV